jgi:cell wall assembly regulator SMI1
MKRLSPELLPRTVPEGEVEGRLRELEERLGAALPAEYRQFLPKWGGALLPGYVQFPVSGDPPFGGGAILDVLFGLLPGDGYDVAENLRAVAGRLPGDLLPVAQDPGGNLICLGVRGARTGRVFFWDHNAALFGRDEGQSVYPVAASWGEFLEALHVGD